jgi:hypothetical protein
MKFRGATRFGGGTYYKLIGAAFAGSPAQPGDAQVEGGGNAARDELLRAADRLTTRVAKEPRHDRQDQTQERAAIPSRERG